MLAKAGSQQEGVGGHRLPWGLTQQWCPVPSCLRCLPRQELSLYNWSTLGVRAPAEAQLQQQEQQ